MPTGVVKDARFANHRPGAGHVESPERVEILNRMVEEDITFPYMAIAPRPATQGELEMIHTAEYIRFVQSTAGRDYVALDADTSTSPLSWETALLAAGGSIQAAALIMDGKIQNALALVRPPGHHAEADEARGFCLFNNVAIAAESLVRTKGLKRILIVDWDLHHGNGTMHSFYGRSDVLYFSTHQYPYYPGTGHWSETGKGPGQGFSLNLPLSPGKTDADYVFIFQKILAPVVRQFNPEFILVSAGFDIYGGDPLGGMEVSAQGFGAMAAELVSLAEEVCAGRLLIVLEGGYSLQGLRKGGREVLVQLAKAEPAPTVQAQPDADTLQELAPAVKAFQQFWSIKI